MFQIIGIVLLFAMVFGSYILTGGNIGVILHATPHEMAAIGGAAPLRPDALPHVCHKYAASAPHVCAGHVLGTTRLPPEAS